MSLTSASTVDLGAGDDPDPRADLTVDAVDLEATDLVHDLEERPWPFEDESLEGIVSRHCFEHLPDAEATLREAERILKPGGWLEVHLPIGVNSRADPDHNPDEWRWCWRTPEYYCGARHWDTDVSLEVVDRDVEVWTLLPGIEGVWEQAKIDWLYYRHGPGPWAFGRQSTSGEFLVRFRKPAVVVDS